MFLTHGAVVRRSDGGHWEATVLTRVMIAYPDNVGVACQCQSKLCIRQMYGAVIVTRCSTFQPLSSNLIASVMECQPLAFFPILRLLHTIDHGVSGSVVRVDIGSVLRVDVHFDAFLLGLGLPCIGAGSRRWERCSQSCGCIEGVMLFPVITRGFFVRCVVCG